MPDLDDVDWESANEAESALVDERPDWAAIHRHYLGLVRDAIPKPKREAIEAAYLLFRTPRDIATWLRLDVVKVEAYLNLVGLRYSYYGGSFSHGGYTCEGGQWTRWKGLLDEEEHARSVMEVVASGMCDQSDAYLLDNYFDAFRDSSAGGFILLASLAPRTLRNLGSFLAAYVTYNGRGPEPDVERICEAWGDYGLVFLLRLQYRDWLGALEALNMQAMRLGPRYRPVLLALRALAMKHLALNMKHVVEDWQTVYSDPRGGLAGLDTPRLTLSEDLPRLARAAAPGSARHEKMAFFLDGVARRDLAAIDTSYLAGKAYCVDRSCRAIAASDSYRCDIEWAALTKDFSPARWFEEQSRMFAFDEREVAQLEANLTSSGEYSVASHRTCS